MNSVTRPWNEITVKIVTWTQNLSFGLRFAIQARIMIEYVSLKRFFENFVIEQIKRQVPVNLFRETRTQFHVFPDLTMLVDLIIRVYFY